MNPRLERLAAEVHVRRDADQFPAFSKTRNTGRHSMAFFVWLDLKILVDRHQRDQFGIDLVFVGEHDSNIGDVLFCFSCRRVVLLENQP